MLVVAHTFQKPEKKTWSKKMKKTLKNRPLSLFVLGVTVGGDEKLSAAVAQNGLNYVKNKNGKIINSCEFKYRMWTRTLLQVNKLNRVRYKKPWGRNIKNLACR